MLFCLLFGADFCPDGQQLISTDDECELCPRGTYKDNKDGKLNNCTTCPEGFTTQDIGSDNILSCNIGKVSLTINMFFSLSWLKQVYMIKFKISCHSLL